MAKKTYDFGGYVTKANLKCSDGRVICPGAFQHCDGARVPLCWGHLRNNPENVLGYMVLEHRDDGMYGYGTFNETDSAKTAKELVRHGDITALSIYANHLKQQGPNVTHGIIREVSLVYAGANPEALIDNITIEHGDGYMEVLSDEAVIYSGEEIEHSEGFEVDIKEGAPESKNDDPTPEPPPVEHADKNQNGEDKEATVKEVFDSLTDDQKALFYAMVGKALSEGEPAMAQSDINEGGNEMSHNVFDQSDKDTNSLTHEERAAITADIFKNAKRIGSLREAVKDYAETLEHGITDIETLFPEAKLINNPPEFVGAPEAWVNTVWNGTKKTPFSRIKSQFADISKDEARAKGYIKGKQKTEEQFSLLKRTTTPQTVYKKQSLDRDDVIDITDFDVVVWMKGEMRMKLQEELARAVLIGDGRPDSSDDKIHQANIRSILHDDPFYAPKYPVDLTGVTTPTGRANAIIDASVRAFMDYKGSGGTIAFVAPSTLADLRLAKDTNGRRLYTNVSEIASAMDVGSIVKVPLMKDLIRYDAEAKKYYATDAIIVDLRDYSIGADKGGETTMFDDFDIDYNKLKYLIETRCSGALTKPASALILEHETTVTPPTPPTPPDEDDDEPVG